VISIWYSFPFIMSTTLGGLQAIPSSLYDACKVDGGGRIAEFRAITMPYLMKSVAPILILGLVLNFNNFGLYFITEGGPVSGSLSNPGATDLFITYIYKLAFSSERYGFASAYSIILFLMIGILTGLAFYFIRKRKGGESV
jgi:ABC-type sugar transport system permease subunit